MIKVQTTKKRASGPKFPVIGKRIQESGSGNSSNVFQFCAQPTSIPGSVLQLLGSSYLLRATAWELYGSAPLSRMNALVHATCFADASSSSDAALAYVKLIQHLTVFKGYRELGRYEVDGYVYNYVEEPKILMAGKWNKSMSYQPCDLDGEPLPNT